MHFRIQNDASASQDDDAVNVSSLRTRCVYAYTLKAVTILSVCTELQQIQGYRKRWTGFETAIT